MGICGSKSAPAEAGTDVGFTAPRKSKKIVKSRYEDTPDFALGLPEDPEARTRGLYLVFEESNGGVLMAIWSETTVDNALAFFFPRVNVPAFKFKNGGRTELIRGLAVNRAKLFAGWKQFFKLANDNDALIQIYTERDTDFWYMDKDLGVHFVERNTWTISREMAIVAILPKSNLSLKGVKKTSTDVFQDTVTKNSGITWRPLN